MECSVLGCQKELGVNDTLFCVDDRIDWRRFVDWKSFNLDNSINSVDKALRVFQATK